MRTYTANLSRRLGPVFSEMAARAASLGPYRAAPLATTEGLLERWNRLRAEDASHAGPAWPAQAGWCKDCTPDNCGGCATPAAGARA